MNSQANIAVCSVELNPAHPSRVQLLPHGKFRGTDGQPAHADHFYLDTAVASRLIDTVRQRKNKMVIDYEHQTLKTADNGHPAPAAGWFKDLEYVEGEGLFATDVEWTAAASTMIANREYKYISLVFPYDRNGVPTNVYNAGLTNFPAIDGMQELQVMAARFYSHASTQELAVMNSKLGDLLKRLRDEKGVTNAQLASAAAGPDATAPTPDPPCSRSCPAILHVHPSGGCAASPGCWVSRSNLYKTRCRQKPNRRHT